MQSLHFGSSWVFCLPKIQGPNLGCKVCILGSSACLKSKAQTLDAKFAFWVFCLPKIQGPNLGCKVCILGLLPAKNSRPKPWMQSLHSGSSSLPKNLRPKPWMQSLHSGSSGSSACKNQGPNLRCKVCILGLLPAENSRPKPWMQSLHSGSSACLKFKAQTLDAKFAFWVFCLPKIQGPNLGCKVCILGLLPA